MIDVEIRGPIATKDYELLKRLLGEAEGGLVSERRVTLAYKDRGFSNREIWLEQKGGRASMRMHAGRPGEREEIALALADGSFTAAVRMLAELGYKKGTVSAEDVLVGRFAGATFCLHEPDNEQYYYEAVMTAGGPTEAKEAEAELEALAKRFKIPVWPPLHMLEFSRRLRDSLDYMYDYETDGPFFFKERYGI